MARHDPPDDARHRRTTQERNDHGLPRHRPHGRLTPYRPPRGRDDAQALPACGPQAHRPRGRRHRHDRRPLDEEPGAQAARRGDPAPQSGGHQKAARQVPRLRQRRSQRRRDGQQLRLDEKLLVPRLHPRRGQAHHRQLHDGQGLGKEASQRRVAAGHVVHRVHLPAGAGL